MRLSSLASLPIDSLSNPRPKIHKAQSSKLTKQMSKTTSLKISHIYNNEEAPQIKQQQVGQIKQFVEQFSSDPLFLARLVDYKQLISNLRQEQLQILQEISDKKKQRSIFQQKIQQTNQNNQKSIINSLRKQQKEICLQIKKFQQQIRNLTEQKRTKTQQRKQQLTKLMKDMKTLRQKQKNAIDKINRQISEIEKNRLSLLSAIKLKQNFISQLQLKAIKNNQKKQVSEILKRQITNQRKTISQLKNQLNLQLSSHKKLIQQNKKQEIEIKKATQKKINKFISEISKIVQKNDRKSFDALITAQVNNIQMRNSNKSSTTNEDQENQYRDPFIIMQLQNPGLKQLREMNLKRIQQTGEEAKKIQKFQKIQKDELKTISQFEQRIKKLNEQQIDSDSFIQALKQKLNKINTQIKNPNKTISIFN